MAYELIERIEVGAGGLTQIDFTNIPDTYNDLQIICSVQASTGTPSGALRFNSAASSAYAYQSIYGFTTGSYGSGGFSQARMIISQVGPDYRQFSDWVIDISGYASSEYKKAMCHWNCETGVSTDYHGFNGGYWNSTSAITEVNLFLTGGDFAQYSSFSLYGIS